MIWLYRLLYLPALIAVLPYYLYRMWRRGGYAKDFQHRFGRFRRLNSPAPGKLRLWIQAVSVGEVLAVRPLLEALQAYDRFEIVLTTTTSTGYREARKHYRDKVYSIGIFPLDFWLFSLTAWRRIQPGAILLTESELWPEHLHQAKARGIPAFLINARMSDRSFRYYLRVSRLTRRLLGKFSEIYTASATDHERFRLLGASEACIKAYGSIKLDVPPPPDLCAGERTEMLASLGFPEEGDRCPLVLLGSSTWPGEEAVLVAALASLLAAQINCRLLLVPRHAERGPEIAAFLESQSLSWHQRSRGPHPAHQVMISLADTTGELDRLTQLADLVFIGKSLPPNQGGQSPLDAAGLGKPLLFGPNMSNFRDIATSLVIEGAAHEIEDQKTLTDQLQHLAVNTADRRAMGAAALNWHQRNRGSSQRVADSVAKALLR